MSSTPPDAPSALTQKAASGALWMIGQNVGSRLITVLGQIVLARLLAPSDFGMIGLALTVTAFMGAVTTYGVDDVLVQRARTLRYWAAAGFWTSLVLASLGMVGAMALSPLAAHLFRAPELVPLILILALAMPLGAIGTVPASVVKTRLEFRTMAGLAALEVAFVQLVTVALAGAGAGVYSFVIPLPLAAGLRSLIYWRLAPPHQPLMRRPRLRQVRYMLGSGSAVSGQRLVNIVISQGDYVMLGLLTTPSVVGLYFFAYRLATQPILMMASNMAGVLLPVASHLRTEADRLRSAVFDAAELLGFIAMPLCLAQVALAKPLIEVLFGAKWEAATPLVQLLSFGMAFDAISWVAGVLLTVRGEFKRSFLYSLTFMPVFVSAIIAGGLTKSALGVATAVGLAYVFVGPTFTYLVLSRTGLTLRQIAVRLFLRPFALASLCVGAAWLIGRAPPIAAVAWVELVVVGALAAGFYVVGLRLFAPEIIIRAMNIAPGKLPVGLLRRVLRLA